MYKGAHQSQQRRADFITPSELAGGTEIQSGQSQRANYVRAINDLEQRILAAPRNSAERRRLGLEKHRLVEEMRALPYQPIKADLGELLIDELRQMVSPAIWDIAQKRARRRYDDGALKDDLHFNRSGHKAGD